MLWILLKHAVCIFKFSGCLSLSFPRSRFWDKNSIARDLGIFLLWGFCCVLGGCFALWSEVILESTAEGWESESEKERQSIKGILACKVHVCAKLRQSCPTLCDPMNYSRHVLLSTGWILQASVLEWVAMQEIFPPQRLNPHLFCPPHWQAGSLSLVPPGKPSMQDPETITAQSQWGNLGNTKEHVSVIPTKGLGYIYQHPVHHWLRVAPGLTESLTLPVWTKCRLNIRL